MSLDYIRGYYKVPAQRFGRITFEGKPGVIVGARGPHLRARVEGYKHIVSLHPTWHVTYEGTLPTDHRTGAGQMNDKNSDVPAEADDLHIELYNEGVASHNELQRVEAELAEVAKRSESQSELIKHWISYGNQVRTRTEKWRKGLAAALGIEPDARGILPSVEELIEKVAEIGALMRHINAEEKQ